MKYLSVIVLLVVLSGCSFFKKKQAADPLIECTYCDLNGKVLAKGYINADSVQTGYWEYYSDSVTTDGGNFAAGLLYGRWTYGLMDFKGVIDWDTAIVFNTIRINYPNTFSHSSAASAYVLLSADSSMEISINRTSYVNDIGKVKDEIENETIDDTMMINRVRCTQVTYDNIASYVLFYDISRDKDHGLDYRMFLNHGKDCFVFRMYSRRFDVREYQHYMTVYLSIINNVFIGRKKLMDPNKVTEADC